MLEVNLNWCKQAKMGMTEEFERSLQVLRGFETDISVEVNEIKVIITIFFIFHFFCIACSLYSHISRCLNFYCHLMCIINESHFIQASVASANRRNTVRISELKQRRYWLPLMVTYFSRSNSLNQILISLN